ncbi:oligodendrocyte-myelin glycoprotein isoform X2 [Pelobates fuscus]|uniref:oligodendrocyte-myelin glycoprotein isoform X2 n=1 Tax=Pelobates fuscus TaxID=191477 RepID=UPI002FE465E2
MASEESFKNGEQKQANDYQWIAALIVAVIIIVMVLVIVVIILCKCMKKSNNVDTNWAGPSPYVTGEIPENTTFHMKESVITKNNLPVSSTNSTTTIHKNALQEWDPQRTEEKTRLQSDSGVKMTIPIPSTLASEHRQSISTIQLQKQTTAPESSDKDILPPPLGSFTESSMHQPSDEYSNSATDVNHLPPPPVSWSDISSCNMVTQCNTDDQQLPLPPPEFLVDT